MVTRKEQLDQATVELYDQGRRLIERRLPGDTNGESHQRWLFDSDSGLGDRAGRTLSWTDGSGNVVKLD